MIEKESEKNEQNTTKLYIPLKARLTRKKYARLGKMWLTSELLTNQGVPGTFGERACYKKTIDDNC